MIGSLHSWIQNRSNINYKYPKEGARAKFFAMNNQDETLRTLKIGKQKCKILNDSGSRSVRYLSANLMNISHQLEALQSEMKCLKAEIFDRTESQTKIEI